MSLASTIGARNPMLVRGACTAQPLVTRSRVSNVRLRAADAIMRGDHHEERHMSPEHIAVTCEAGVGGWTCVVTVGDPARGRQTEHEVSVSQEDLARLAPGAADPDDLVERSFGFLLHREPKESILRRFDLPVIGRYFPEYEATIRSR